MSKMLTVFEQLLVEAAESFLVVEEFENIPGEDNVRALSDFETESDGLCLMLIDYLRDFGPEIRELIAERHANRSVAHNKFQGHSLLRALRGEM